MPFNILIVDDSKIVHAMLTQALEMTDIELGEIFHAMNGREGLDLLRRHSVDLVLSDIHMPEMDGVEMVEQVRLDESLRSIPIVVISSEGSRKRMEQLRENGVQYFIRKPFTPEKINESIRQAMGEDYD
ncbi:MAG: response regulator [Candidatus Omnitrophica bacterium]|nr:response regulator [Candidatus Omnitrophota bacterium]